jgi:hypothetical protein
MSRFEAFLVISRVTSDVELSNLFASIHIWGLVAVTAACPCARSQQRRAKKPRAAQLHVANMPPVPLDGPAARSLIL